MVDHLSKKYFLELGIRNCFCAGNSKVVADWYKKYKTKRNFIFPLSTDISTASPLFPAFSFNCAMLKNINLKSPSILKIFKIAYKQTNLFCSK